MRPIRSIAKLSLTMVFILLVDFFCVAQVGLVFPKDGQVLSDTSVTLIWDKIYETKTYSYQVQVASDSVFSQIIEDQITSDDSILFHSGYGKYYWRVRAMEGIDVSDWSTSWNFITFIPSTINGCFTWFSSDTGVVESASKVIKWQNLMEDTLSAVQNNTTYQPSLVDSVINGKPVVRFNGTMLLFPMQAFSEYSFIVVVSTGPSKNRYEGYLSSNFHPDFRMGLNLGTDQSVGAGFVQGPLGSNNFGTSDHVLLDKFHILSTVKRGTKWYLSANGNLIRIVISTYVPTDVGNFDWGLGAELYKSKPNAPLVGDISEVVVYSKGISDSEQKLVEKYADQKYYPPADLKRNPMISTTSFCGNITLSPGAYFTSYLWSTGDTTSSINVTSPGTYWVNVTDEFGYESSDTVTVQLPLPFNQLPKTNTICPGDTLAWDTGYPKTGYSFLWQDNSTDSVFKITQAGSYYVTVQDGSSCYHYSDTITVSLSDFPNTATLGPDTNLCSGNLIYLKTGADVASVYSWSDGSSNSSLPVYTTGQYSLTATDIYGCVKKDTVNIVITALAPTVDFLFDTVCFGDTTGFIDLSAPPSGNSIVSRFWDFGNTDTLTSPSTNLSYYYSDTGAYNVKLTVTTDVGCAVEKEHIVHVSSFPQISFTATNLCKNGQVQFSANAITDGHPIGQWSWDFNDPASGVNNGSSIQNPTHIFASANTYTVQLIAQNVFGCGDTSSNSITIKPSAIPGFTYSKLCFNSLVQFTSQASTVPSNPITAYFWDFEDLATSAFTDPTHTFLSDAVFNVKQVVTTSNGCKDSIITPLTIPPKPLVAYTYSNTCVHSPLAFIDSSSITSGSISSWKWSFGDGASSSQQNPQHVYSDTINAMVKLVATSDQGCKDSLTKYIPVRPSPLVDYTADPPYGSPPLSVVLTGNATGATNYEWKLNSVTFDTLANTALTFSDLSVNTVIFIVGNSYGCKDSSIQTIDVTIKKIDVGVEGITASISKNDYLTLLADIRNYSSEDIYSMNISTQISNTTVINDVWNGTLVKGGLLVYQIPSGVLVDEKSHFVCVYVSEPNGVEDEEPENDYLCKSFDDSKFKVIDPYPNPTEIEFNLPIVVPANDEVKIYIYDYLGQLTRDVYSAQFTKGMSLIDINLTGFETGIYFIKVEYRGESVLKRIVVK